MKLLYFIVKHCVELVQNNIQKVWFLLIYYVKQVIFSLISLLLLVSKMG